MRNVAKRFDGAYCLVLLNALGEMVIARDPWGFRPLCYAIEGPLLAAASESVALLNLGFSHESIRSLEPGQMISVSGSKISIERFAESPRQAHCFFEWIYFANVASTMDGRSVYLARKSLGEELARLEDVSIDEDTIVVPVPDTSKCAADAMAYRLGVPSAEGLIRNRYSGRTFIEGTGTRANKAASKYTPLREVLEGKRVLLVEDSIVRSTTMRVLISRMRKVGQGEGNSRPRGLPADHRALLLRHRHVDRFRTVCAAVYAGRKVAARDVCRDGPRAWEPIRCGICRSTRSLRALNRPADELCRACLTGRYPTPHGQQLYQIALANAELEGEIDPTESRGTRTYEAPATLA